MTAVAFYAQAQKARPLYEAYFSHPDDMQQDEGGGYHFNVGDSLTVYMSDDGYYKMVNRNGKVVEEGDTDEGDDNFTRHGKWSEYYADGTLKASGSYAHDQPYGHWQLFGANGKIQSEYDILVIIAEDGTKAYCRAGEEIVYYSDGRVKEERFFLAEPYNGEERVAVEDPETGKKTWSKVAVKSYRAKPFGSWTYYNPDGTVEKKEDRKD